MQYTTWRPSAAGLEDETGVAIKPFDEPPEVVLGET